LIGVEVGVGFFIIDLLFVYAGVSIEIWYVDVWFIDIFFVGMVDLHYDDEVRVGPIYRS